MLWVFPRPALTLPRGNYISSIDLLRSSSKFNNDNISLTDDSHDLRLTAPVSLNSQVPFLSIPRPVYAWPAKVVGQY
jgi:hypothetical protein